MRWKLSWVCHCVFQYIFLWLTLVSLSTRARTLVLHASDKDAPGFSTTHLHHPCSLPCIHARPAIFARFRLPQACSGSTAHNHCVPSFPSTPLCYHSFCNADIQQMILMPLEAVVGAAMNAMSRHYEYQADNFACLLQDQLKAPEMSDMGDRLGRALVQLHVKNLSTVWVDWLYVIGYSSSIRGVLIRTMSYPDILLTTILIPL